MHSGLKGLGEKRVRTGSYGRGTRSCRVYRKPGWTNFLGERWQFKKKKGSERTLLSQDEDKWCTRTEHFRSKHQKVGTIDGESPINDTKKRKGREHTNSLTK